MCKEACRLAVWMVVGVALMVFSGCRAPRPSFNFWAPFGSSRVAPPKTGSYSTPQNYYPKDSAPSTGAPVIPQATPVTPVSPVQPGSDFPGNASTNPSGMGTVNEVKDVRVGKWRPPKHDPHVRSVSFETNLAPETVPTVAIPSMAVSVAGAPRQLTENQTRIAIPMTKAVSVGNREPGATVPQDAGVVKARFQEPSAVAPAASTDGWSQRKTIRP